MSALKNIVGRKFGRLVVTCRSDRKDGKYTYWQCRCECGREITGRADMLRSGKTKSCGCINIERFTKVGSTYRLTHGEARVGHRSPEFQTWMGMKSRCLNTKTKAYKYYGGRGISICQRWLDSFENFLADMGRRPSSKHSIDRINNEGNYEPKNCWWATIADQAINRRFRPRFDEKGQPINARQRNSNA